MARAWHGMPRNVKPPSHMSAQLCPATPMLTSRRLMRDMQSRTQQEHSEKLAASNAAIVRHAARALIRNADTLQLMGIGSSAGSGAGSGTEGSHGPVAAERGSHEHAAGGHRISGLICFDEMQVGLLVRLDGCSLAVVHGALRACSAAVLPLQHPCREAVASTPRPLMSRPAWPPAFLPHRSPTLSRLWRSKACLRRCWPRAVWWLPPATGRLLSWTGGSCCVQREPDAHGMRAWYPCLGVCAQLHGSLSAVICCGQVAIPCHVCAWHAASGVSAAVRV